MSKQAMKMTQALTMWPTNSSLTRTTVSMSSTSLSQAVLPTILTEEVEPAEISSSAATTIRVRTWIWMDRVELNISAMLSSSIFSLISSRSAEVSIKRPRNETPTTRSQDQAQIHQMRTHRAVIRSRWPHHRACARSSKSQTTTESVTSCGRRQSWTSVQVKVEMALSTSKMRCTEQHHLPKMCTRSFSSNIAVTAN